MTNKREHLLEIFKDLDTALLFTHAVGGELRGRPMALAEIQDSGELVFPTGLRDDKVAQIEADPRVALGVQGKSKWAYLAGQARISRDRSMIDRLWKEPWKLWFPQGQNDRFAIEAAKAYIHGREPDANKMDENAKVKL